MIRTFFFYIVLFISTAIHGGGSIIASVLGVKRRGLYDWGTQGWSRWNLWAAGTPLDVQGIEQVPPGPVVYASNHSSMFDIWALSAALPGSTRFVAKQELTKIPFFGSAMVAAGHVTIDRFNRGELSQKEAQLEIEHFWAGALRRAVIDGDVEAGSLMAGQSVGLVTREQSTAEILAELVGQALAAIASRDHRFTSSFPGSAEGQGAGR